VNVDNAEQFFTMSVDKLSLSQFPDNGLKRYSIFVQGVIPLHNTFAISLFSQSLAIWE